MGFKFHKTTTLKEMVDRAEREKATEIKRILPEQRNLTDVTLGFRSARACKN